MEKSVASLGAGWQFIKMGNNNLNSKKEIPFTRNMGVKVNNGGYLTG